MFVYNWGLYCYDVNVQYFYCITVKITLFYNKMCVYFTELTDYHVVVEEKEF